MASASATTGIRAVRISRARDRARASAVAFLGVCLWLFAAPFEATRPLVHLPGQSISSAEGALLAVLLAWAGSALMAADGPAALLAHVRTPLTLPWLAFLTAVVAAALLAPGDRANAVHMAGRLMLAFGVFIVTVNGVTTRGRLQMVLGAAAVVGAAVSVLALLEFLGNPMVLQALRAFRPGVAVVGAQVRASGPFQYPTIASMYLEVLFAFVLGALLVAIDGRHRFGGAVAFAVLVLLAEAIILTFTRSGLITMGLSVVLVGALRSRERGLDGGAKALVALAAILALEALTSRPVGATRLRMTSEMQDDWYRASIEAPLDLAFATGETTTVPVTVTNAGRTTWDSDDARHPYKLSYHWLLADADVAESYEGLRTPFVAPVAPNGTARVMARVRAPGTPGRYRLMWDVVQEGQLWFSTEPGAEFVVTRASVSGPALGGGASGAAINLPTARARPGRFTLWRAAIRMIAAHPWLGVGPDNFRLLYGPYAGIANPDSRVHSNNTYLEVLAGGGIVAAAAFLWLAVRVLMLLRRAGRAASSPPLATASAAVTAAVCAIGVHGLADSFLSFTATYVLFAITLGLAVACDRLTSTHAHRV